MRCVSSIRTWYDFASAPPPPPSAFKQRLADRQGRTLKAGAPLILLGRLYLPEGPPPFPAVVLLHGSGGIGAWNEVWAARLRDWGYAVLDVDSHTPRGLYRHNTGVGGSWSGQAKYNASASVRGLDALGALAFIARHSLIDPERIAVLGMSQGGAAAMFAIAGGEVPHIAQRFRAAVALYPPCYDFRGYDAPLLLLIGSADQQVSAALCERRLAAAGSDNPLLLQVYPGAHHLFDLEGPPRGPEGRLMAHDPAAAADAIQRIEAFLAAQLQ